MLDAIWNADSGGDLKGRSSSLRRATAKWQRERIIVFGKLPLALAERLVSHTFKGLLQGCYKISMFL